MKHLLILLFLAVSSILSAQTYLNKIYPSFGGSPAPAILVDDSSYVVASTYILGLNTIHFGRLDFNGTAIVTKPYTLRANSYTGTCAKCLKQNNGQYYYAQTNFVRGDSLYVTFWKLDQNLDTMFTRKHIEFEGRLPRIYDLEFDSDSTFMVSGYVFSINGGIGKYDLWVAKFDTAFNVVWEKRVEDNFPNLHYGYYGQHLTIDNYGSALISGQVFTYYAGVDTNFYSMTARFDRETGDLIWKKDFVNPPGSDYFATIDQGDGTYRFAQRQYLRIVPRTLGYADSSQLRFGAMDTLGNIIWDKMLGPKYGQFHFRDLQHTSDGNYYLAGELRVPPSYDYSSGFKISPIGDSLWLKTYLHLDSADVSHIWSFLETPDSGFVHFGLYGDEDNDLDPVRIQYSWMLKTDKYGCAVKDCHTIGIPEVRHIVYNAKVYPNPSAGSFVIEIPEGQLVKNLMAEVYNTSGKRVYQGPINDYKSRINLTNIAPGLYLLKITEGQSEVYNQKIIIQ